MNKRNLFWISQLKQKVSGRSVVGRSAQYLFCAMMLWAVSEHICAQKRVSTVDYELGPIPEVQEALPENSVPLGNAMQFKEVKMDLPITPGPYQPTWESIESNYPGTPEWLRDAKFGIWVHFGPQAAGESGDWYARKLYVQGTTAYNNHVKKYGHPSEAGYKEVLKDWNPDQLDPKKLVEIYKDAGARFLIIQGVHHDQFDMWDSKYQPWNSTRLGPKRDLIGEWETAVRQADMHFGITFHHEYSWWWWQTAFQSDNTGPKAGVPYDGHLTLEDGVGKWWEGLDPRYLYGVNLREYETVASAANSPYSPPSAGIFRNHLNFADWYTKWWALRIMDAVDKYNPDFIYTDGTDQQPFSGFGTGTGYKCDAMQRVIADFYNKTLERRGKVDVFSIVKFRSKTNGTVNTQEGSIPGNIKTDQAWIAEMPVGDWFYAPNYVYSSSAVIRYLLEEVSRDGCFGVCVSLRPDGSLDEGSTNMLKEIGEWMRINGEGIYGSHAWKVLGEGANGKLNVLPGGGIGWSQANHAFSTSDFRFTVGKNDSLYVWCMTVPQPGAKLKVTSLGTSKGLLSAPVTSVKLLGYDGDIEWSQTADGLNITCPQDMNFKTAICFRLGPVMSNYSTLTDLIEQAQTMLDAAEQNIGSATGQYKATEINTFKEALTAARNISEDAAADEISAGVTALQNAMNMFEEKGQNAGGVLVFDSVQNITNAVLNESRNFSRADEPLASGRWGLLGEPWKYNSAVLNQENGTRGGFDNYDDSRSISFQKWDLSMPAIENGKIYQTTTLPAGTYRIKIKVHECTGLRPGEVYLNVAEGEGLPDTEDVTSQALASYDMFKTATGKTETVCLFILEKETKVSIGFTATIGAAATERSMRVNSISLMQGIKDVSSKYLANYKNIQRKDFSYARFGTPLNWTVENFECQTASEGLRNGIDRWSGYNALMMGFWGDASQAKGDPTNAKLYKKVTLPAGRYVFSAAYDVNNSMTDMYMFAAKELPDLADLKQKALAYYPITYVRANGEHHGLTFTLDKEATIYLGWIGNLTTSANLEFRVFEVNLLRVLDDDTAFLPQFIYDATEKDQEYSFTTSQMESLNDVTCLSSLEDVRYVEGHDGSSMVVGQIDFGKDHYASFFVNSANVDELPEDASFDFYLDDDTQPIACVQAIVTDGKLVFAKSVSDYVEVEGVHKLTVKYRHHDANLYSVGFRTSAYADGVENVQENADAHICYCDARDLVVKGLDKEWVRIYTADGRRIYQKEKSGTIRVPVKPGLYFVEIGRHVYKLLCPVAD